MMSVAQELQSSRWVVIGFAINAFGGLFQAYALTMAPQSVISALVPVVLVANCAFAPCLLGEAVGKRDLQGTAAIIVSTLVVVLAGQISPAADADGTTAACNSDDFTAEELLFLLHRGPHLVFAGLTVGVIGLGYTAVQRATRLVELDMMAITLEEATPITSTGARSVAETLSLSATQSNASTASSGGAAGEHAVPLLVR